MKHAIQQGSLLDMPASERKEVKPSQPVTEKKMSRLEDLIAELCPNGVEHKTLGDCAEYIRGVVYNKSAEINDNSEGYKVLRANNISLNTNTLNFDDIKVISKS